MQAPSIKSHSKFIFWESWVQYYQYGLFPCSWSFKYNILEVMILYPSAFVTYGNKIESKGVQFHGRDALDRINRGSWFAVVRDSSTISAFVVQEHHIRMRSDERNNLSQEFLRGCPCTSRLLIFFLKIWASTEHQATLPCPWPFCQFHHIGG